MKAPKEIETPKLGLAHASVEEHCRALSKMKKVFFWWYMGLDRFPWNFSVPFEDGSGTWWYQVKPGFCWTADAYAKLDKAIGLPLAKRFLGCQHMAAPGAQANSRIIINTVPDLPGFGIANIEEKRRNIRAGARLCELEVLSVPDERAFSECAAVWNSFQARTGWKRPVEAGFLSEGWRRLLDAPGVSIVVGREKASGRAAGFLIAKVMGDTAYVDTIAASTELLHVRVNDILMHSFLVSAQSLGHVKRAHYSIVSYRASLERFKRSHGFVPANFPARTSLTPAVGALIRGLSRASYNRMFGKMDVSAA